MKTYRSIAPIAVAVMAATASVLAIAAASAANVVAWNLVEDEAAWPTFEDRARLLHDVGVPLTAVALVLTAVFIGLATRNLHDLGPGRPRFAGGAAVWWLFVPVANVFMVHQILTALWRESQPTPPLRLVTGVERSVALVDAWWLLVVAMYAATVIGPRVAHGHGPLAHIASVLAETVFRLAAGGCFIAIVQGVRRRQREQWRDLERRRGVPQPTADALR